MQPVKLVTLDVTNTVIRVVGGVGFQYANVAKVHGVKLNPDDVSRAFNSTKMERTQ